uniref:Uncharacterized protein n=1 Tax=Acrobeloides nanus TaxID=290746 RepID=A0A914BVM3_9BILA
MAEMRPAIIKLHEKDIRSEKSSSFLMFRNHQLILILSAMKKPEATKIGKEEIEKRQPGVEKTFKEPKASCFKACVEAKGGHFE